MPAAPVLSTGQRARFVALKRQMFAELGCAIARFRLAWLIPFNLLVIVVLAEAGMKPLRLAIEAVALFGSAAIFRRRLWMIRRGDSTFVASHLFASALFYFLAIANTGGISSPLLITCVPVLVSSSLHPVEPRTRGAFFTFFGAGMVAMALAAHATIGAPPGPLIAAASYPTTDYVVLAAGSFILVISSVYCIGSGVTLVYERVGFELAERREEICSETEDRTRALEGVAARLAHEVKNPLAAIKGLSTHMARSSSDPKVAERLAIVSAEADRLHAVVDEFLSFSRGLDELKLGTVGPHALAQELILLLEARADTVGVRLEVKGAEELVLTADGRKLRQALLNLVLNAIRASHSGDTVTIEVAKCGGNAARIKVIDRGQGMTAEVLERIQKPYFTTQEGRTGLGVAVARGLVAQHGGQLHYDSTPGKGTTVTIDLPASAKAALAERKLPNPAASPAGLPQGEA